MSSLYNLVCVSTPTTGTGPITLGAAILGSLTFAQGGVPDAEEVSYGIRDGANSWMGKGVYTASGTTLTRTVTHRSTGAGNNTDIALSGNAEVFITPAAEDFAATGTGLLVRHVAPTFTGLFVNVDGVADAVINGAASGAGANFKLIGNGGTTPNKTIRVYSGVFEILNNAYNSSILYLTDAGSLIVPKFTSSESAHILHTNATITGGGTGNAPTLTAGPVTGNPTKWLPYDDNGTTRYIPSW